MFYCLHVITSWKYSKLKFSNNFILDIYLFFIFIICFFIYSDSLGSYFSLKQTWQQTNYEFYILITEKDMKQMNNCIFQQYTHTWQASSTATFL